MACGSSCSCSTLIVSGSWASQTRSSSSDSRSSAAASVHAKASGVALKPAAARSHSPISETASSVVLLHAAKLVVAAMTSQRSLEEWSVHTEKILPDDRHPVPTATSGSIRRPRDGRPEVPFARTQRAPGGRALGPAGEPIDRSALALWAVHATRHARRTLRSVRACSSRLSIATRSLSTIAATRVHP